MSQVQRVEMYNLCCQEQLNREQTRIYERALAELELNPEHRKEIWERYEQLKEQAKNRYWMRIMAVPENVQITG